MGAGICGDLETGDAFTDSLNKINNAYGGSTPNGGPRCTSAVWETSCRVSRCLLEDQANRGSLHMGTGCVKKRCVLCKGLHTSKRVEDNWLS